MAERVKALVEPTLLVWARKTASLSVEAAANAIGVAAERLTSWEDGSDRPTIAQLKKAAGVYKRPLSVFYLPEPPTDFSALRDFRRLPESGTREYSPELAYEVRAAHERRDAALDIFEGAGEEPPRFPVHATIRSNPETIAAEIRNALQVTIAQQSHWNDPAVGFRAWRESIESQGVLVSVLGGAHHGVSLDEMRGFAIADQPLPMIVVNGSDPYNARIFTLLHELGHVVLGQSIIENEIEPGADISAPNRAIEVFCNRLAAAVLMPADALQAEAILQAKPGVRRDWTDAEIAALAQRYSVSRDALVIRLGALGRATDDFVRAKRAAYARQYAAAQAAISEEPEQGGFAPYRYQLINYIGRGFARLVFQAYHERRLSLNTVSAYLGTQAKYVPTIENLAFSSARAGA